MIGKLNNHAGKRFDGFEVQLGFGLGDGFKPSTLGDGLKIALNDENPESKPLGSDGMAEFPGGLFYGPADDKHGWGFFSSTRAYYTVDISLLDTDEDSFTSIALSDNYTDLVGEWLPITWVPTGYFFDDDGNPATDNIVVSWYDGNEWISYDIDESTGQRSAYNPDAATLYMWATTPPTVWDDDGDMTTTTGGTLIASWDAENEVYVKEDGSGDTLENNDIVKLLDANVTYERRTGYMTGPIEDLANLNLNYYIEVAEASTWPTFDGTDTASFTLRIMSTAVCFAGFVSEWAARVSVICSPTVMTGFNAENGSWKMIDISLPLTCLNPSWSSFSKSASPAPYFTSPAVILPSCGLISFRMEYARVDLPQPDSPTMLKVSFSPRSKDTFSRAFIVLLLR